MLVLSRQKNESIIIGTGDDKVEVMIVDVRGDKVRLGITAPRSTSVHRKEIYEAIQRENTEKTALVKAAQKTAEAEFQYDKEQEQPVDPCHPVN